MIVSFSYTRAWNKSTLIRVLTTTTAEKKLNASLQENQKPNDFMCWAADGVPTHPIHYAVYSSRLAQISRSIFSSAAFVVVWSQGLKGSVDTTFKAPSSVPARSQEMSLSLGLCLSQEKQRATWESAGSHGLYQRLLSVPIRQSGSVMGWTPTLPCFFEVRGNPKLI